MCNAQNLDLHVKKKYKNYYFIAIVYHLRWNITYNYNSHTIYIFIFVRLSVCFIMCAIYISIICDWCAIRGMCHVKRFVVSKSSIGYNFFVSSYINCIIDKPLVFKNKKKNYSSTKQSFYLLTFLRNPLVPGFWPSNGVVETSLIVTTMLTAAN